jgi:solute carrier family 39 (zinc transporter), member 1/2/3
MNAFAGGVFLSAGFVHLLPEAAEIFSDNVLSGAAAHVPLAHIIATSAFLLTLVVERLLLHGHHHHHGHGHDHVRDHGAKAEGLLSSGGADDAAVPYVLALVLAVHSLFEGLALGVAADVGRATVLLVAILGHKWMEAAGVGVSMVRQNFRMSASLNLTKSQGALLRASSSSSAAQRQSASAQGGLSSPTSAGKRRVQ